MTITLISTPPRMVTREEAIELHLNPEPILNDEEIPDIVRYTQNNVHCHVSPSIPDGMLEKGSLFVTESKLYFYSPQTSTGLAIDYPTIVIHAVSRQQALDGIGPCIYLQLNDTLRLGNSAPEVDTQQQQTEENSEEEEEGQQITEIKIVPDDIGALDAIFEALSECAALHPDKEFMQDDDDDDYYDYDENQNEVYHENGNGDESQWFTRASDEQELSEVGRASLAYLNSVIDGPVPVSQRETATEIDETMFEDAEEEGKQH